MLMRCKMSSSLTVLFVVYFLSKITLFNLHPGSKKLSITCMVGAKIVENMGNYVLSYFT